MDTKQGKFIVIDGMDGSGKTEQTRLLVERMTKEGFPVKPVSFPCYTAKSCGPVEEYLAGTYGTPEEVGPRRASILYAVDRWAASRSLCDTLAAGTHLVANRYVASNMGHQGSKIADPAERAEYFRWNDDLEYGLFGIPRPDINVILHVPAAISMRLIEKRGNAKDAHENLEHLRAAETTYLEIARTFPGFALVECVDDRGTLLGMPVIHEKVWSIVRPLLV